MNRNFPKILKYSFIKLSLIPINLWIISTFVFILLRIAPGDPVDAILGTSANKVSRELLREKLGLNDSLINQYTNYLNDLLQLNLGDSLSNQEPVISIISKSLPASIELGFFGIIIAALLGFPLGYLGLKNKDQKYDYISRIISIGSYAIPPFWGAMIAQLIFSIYFRIFPIIYNSFSI